jgi:hypothetical protein
VPLQYQASKFVVKALRILVACPGLTATQVAWICWEKDKGRYPLNAGIALSKMHKRGLVFSRIKSRFWEAGSPRPRKQWYVTDKGFDVHEFYERQRQDGNSPYADGTRRTSC